MSSIHILTEHDHSHDHIKSIPDELMGEQIETLTIDADHKKPLGLVVILENVGHIVGLNLPQWAMNVIDYVTEEYSKILLRLYGAHRRYDQVFILEDEQVNGPEIAQTLLQASKTHQIDVLLLVHGLDKCIVGYQGKEHIGLETFSPLCSSYKADPSLLDIRMVYGLNCHGSTLAPVWLEMGAKAVNGAVGINWFPEPSLSIFLRSWLKGEPYSDSVQKSNRIANRIWRLILPTPREQGCEHPWIESSRQMVFGQQDLCLDT